MHLLGKVGSFAEQNKSIIDKLSSKNKTFMKKIAIIVCFIGLSGTKLRINERNAKRKKFFYFVLYSLIRTFAGKLRKYGKEKL